MVDLPVGGVDFSLAVNTKALLIFMKGLFDLALYRLEGLTVPVGNLRPWVVCQKGLKDSYAARAVVQFNHG